MQLPPVERVDLLESGPGHESCKSMRAEHRTLVLARESLQRGHVEVILVIVADENAVDGTARRCAPRLPPNKSSVPNLSPKSRSHHTQTLTKPILDSLLPAPVALHRASLLTPARLNRHNRLPTGGSLQTAVSDAPRSTEPTCILTVGRIRYSTRVSGQLTVGRPDTYKQ